MRLNKLLLITALLGFAIGIIAALFGPAIL